MTRNKLLFLLFIAYLITGLISPLRIVCINNICISYINVVLYYVSNFLVDTVLYLHNLINERL